MKGAIASQIFAAKAVIDSKVSLSSSFMLGYTVDDETAGSWGMKYAIEKGLPSIGWPKPTAHVLGEAPMASISLALSRGACGAVSRQKEKRLMEANRLWESTRLNR